jgi:hypothetical protein
MILSFVWTELSLAECFMGLFETCCLHMIFISLYWYTQFWKICFIRQTVRSDNWYFPLVPDGTVMVEMPCFFSNTLPLQWERHYIHYAKHVQLIALPAVSCGMHNCVICTVLQIYIKQSWSPFKFISLEVYRSGLSMYKHYYISSYLNKWQDMWDSSLPPWCSLTLSLLMLYIYGAPCKARNFNIVYICMYIYMYGPMSGNAESHLFLFAAQCFKTESMHKVILWHSCV